MPLRMSATALRSVENLPPLLSPLASSEYVQEIFQCCGTKLFMNTEMVEFLILSDSHCAFHLYRCESRW